VKTLSFVLLGGVLLLSSCNEQFDIAGGALHVRSIIFGTELDDRGVISAVRTEFVPTESTIYAIVELTGVLEEVDVTGRWVYVPLEKEFASATIQAAPLRELARFDLSSKRPWPVGEYRLDVEVIQGKETATGNGTFQVIEEKRSLSPRAENRNTR
jgi:hypothetical protein